MRAPSKVARFPVERFLAFLEKLTIISKDYGTVPFRLLGTQKYVLDEMVEALDRGITVFVILKARQLGMSTFFIALDLFWAMEYPGVAGAFATHTDQSRDQFRNIIKTFFRFLPRTHKIGIETENRGMLILDNRSLFAYLVAGVKQKDTGSLGRSGAYNYCHGTEVAFWGSPDDLQELRATMSTHYAHRLQIWETTANGFNFFADMWDQAKTSATQKAIFVGWWRHDDYRFSFDHPFFGLYVPDAAKPSLTARERRGIKGVRDQHGFEIGLEQIAWYRWKLEDECSGDQAKMDEMFPWVEEDAFVATGAKFFTNDALTDGMRRLQRVPYQPFRYHVTDRWHDTDVRPGTRERHDLKLWEEASPTGTYVIGCDPAYGSSDTADRTAIAVYRCYSDRLVQVAEYVSNSIKTYQCAWVLAHLAGYYRDVMVNIEITGPGMAVFDALNQLKQEMARWNDATEPGLKNVLGNFKHYLYRRQDALGSGGMAFQWKTGPQNKPYMMNSFKDSFELNRAIVNSMPTLGEMQTMVIEGSDIRAEGHKKDDRVMASALAHIAWHQWVKPRMIAQGRTYKSELERKGQGPNQVMRMIQGYLKSAKINVDAS